MNEQLVLLSLTGLLPCPFCGQAELSRFSRKEENETPTPICIQCDSCGATGPVAATHDQLSALWDVRANEGRAV